MELNRPIGIVGAPSNIGIKPYESGVPRGLDRAPAVLRQLGVVERLRAIDSGDVIPPPYRDLVRTPGRVRNEGEVAEYSRSLADRIAGVVNQGRFALVLGGDCSIVLASLIAVRSATRPSIGLAYIDGHADFATPAESQTGSAASMCLSLAVGRGDTPLARLAGDAPLVDPGDVALVGRRDEADAWYGHDALRASAVLDLPHAAVDGKGYAHIAAPILDRIARPELQGFWIHVDADVINPAVMPAVDSPETGGPGLDELAQLLIPLVRHPKALGMELTIYDPELDPELECGKRLVEWLENVLTDVPGG